MNAKVSSYLKDIFSVTFIIIIGLSVLSGFSERVDINLTDDTGYLVLGLRITQGVLAGFGPLYSILYKVLKQIHDDPVQIYDTAMILLYIAPAVCAYIFLRALNVKAHWAFLVSAFFMISPTIMSFITWSKISHYTICIVFLWGAWTTRMKTPLQVLFSLVVLTFFLGYVRPESHLSWYISSVVFLIYWIWKEQDKFEMKKLLLVVPVAGMLFLFFFLTLAASHPVLGKINLLLNPMAGNRTFIAFAQQFSYNYCEWNHLDNYDWIQWRDITKNNFGEFETLSQAFKNNPSLFAKHIAYNIQQYILKALSAVQGIFFPPAIFRFPVWISWILILILAGARIGYTGWSQWYHQVKEILTRHCMLVAGIVIFSIPSVIASVVFYTREHYLVLLMPLVLMLFVLLLAPRKAGKENLPRIVTGLQLPVVVLIAFLIKPSLADYRTFDVWDEYTYPSNRKTIEAIRRMGFTQDISEVDHEGGFAIYTGKNFRWATPFQKEEQPYSEFIDRFQPNLYYVTKALLSNRFFYEDPQFMDIIHHPEKYDLRRVALQPENKGYLLVHDTLTYNSLPY